MAKTIRRGEGVSKECKMCKSLIEFDANDLVVNDVGDDYFNCPECKAPIYTHIDELPKWWHFRYNEGH